MGQQMRRAYSLQSARSSQWFVIADAKAARTCPKRVRVSLSTPEVDRQQRRPSSQMGFQFNQPKVHPSQKERLSEPTAYLNLGSARVRSDRIRSDWIGRVRLLLSSALNLLRRRQRWRRRRFRSVVSTTAKTTTKSTFSLFSNFTYLNSSTTVSSNATNSPAEPKCH